MYKLKKIISLGLSLIIAASLSSCSSAHSLDSPSLPSSEPKTSSQESSDSPTSSEPLKAVDEQSSSEELTPVTGTVEISGNLKVHFIDVGQADSIFIELPSSQCMLIDAGNNADGANVVSYIKKLKYSKIDYIIGTHPHEDHIGGLDNVINSFEIGSIYMPRIADADVPTTKTYSDVLTAIANKGLKISTAKAGKNIFNYDNLKADIIAPNSSDYKDLNDYSAVIKLTYGATSFLFTGDAEDISEEEISTSVDIKSDVIKVGHHGSDSSTSPAFLKRVSPKYAVISVGAGNTYGHPSANTISKLNKIDCAVYRTDESGTIVFTSDSKTITVDKKASQTKEQAPPSSTVTKSTSSAPEKDTTSAEEPPKSITVYVTKSGSKYHSDGCQYLKKSKIAMSLSDAKASGYDPCSKCNPPS